jgi:predicted nucleic acid-binding protein
MSHLLDSNICSAHFRRPGGLAHRFIQYGGGLFVPTVVLGELYAGAYHLGNPAPLLQKSWNDGRSLPTWGINEITHTKGKRLRFQVASRSRWCWH